MTRTHRRRRGVTLVEVMIALVLVAIGLLGMAGSSALLLRAAAVQRADRSALRVATLRLASLAAGGCALARDGTAADPATGVREAWRVDTRQPAVAFVEHHAWWTARGVAREAVVRSAFLC